MTILLTLRVEASMIVALSVSLPSVFTWAEKCRHALEERRCEESGRSARKSMLGLKKDVWRTPRFWWRLVPKLVVILREGT